MRKRVLLVAREVELRAKFACAFQSAGYAIELACDEQRALRLAAACNFHVAIVAPEPSPTSLALTQQLRDKVPEMIVLAEGPDEIDRLRRSLSGVHAFFLKTSNEGALITRVGEMTASADSESSVSGILCIEDCKLDFGGCVFVDANGREVALTHAEFEPTERIGEQSLPGRTARKVAPRRCRSRRGSLRSQHRHACCAAPAQNRARSEGCPIFGNCSWPRIQTHGSAAEC